MNLYHRPRALSSQAAITGERNSVFRSFGMVHESLQDSEEAFGFGVESF
jgi:hypothetical protein